MWGSELWESTPGGQVPKERPCIPLVSVPWGSPCAGRGMLRAPPPLTPRGDAAGGSPAGSVGQSPLRQLQECLQSIGIPDPI